MNQVNINKKEGEVKLIVDTKFYGSGAIMQAAKEFGESCWVLVDGDKDDKMLVSLKPKLKDIELDTLGYEFYNYMLGLVQDAYNQ